MKTDYVLNDFDLNKTYTKEEQKAHRENWIKALRSGEFKQTTGKLKSRNGSYCCLGLACELAGIEPRWVVENPELNGDGYIYLGETLVMPNKVMQYYGLIDSCGDYNPDPNIKGLDGYVERSSLASQNDDGKSFKEIADIIESEPTGLVE